MTTPRIHEAGDAALLLDLDDVVDVHVNARAIAIAGAIRAAAVAGVHDVVPTIRSVAVYFDPLRVDRERLTSVVQHVRPAAVAVEGRTIEVPVAYGGEFGPDLQAIADFAGLPADRVVDLHAGRDYRVFMLGFLPGFPYLGVVDDRIAAPRRATPRRRVVSGSVGIAGRQTGIYPRDSPGGWQIVGRTALTLFDPRRTPASLLAPGDTVRFHPTVSVHAPAPPGEAGRGSTTEIDAQIQEAETAGAGQRRVTVLRPGLLTTIQDSGRWGHQASGVPVAGPLDPFSHRLANALVGNGRDAATLEITLAGPELRLEHDARIAVTGADLEATVDGRPAQMHVPLACRAGSVLRFNRRRYGTRAYLAFDGGVASTPVLGSRATHVLSGMGGLDGRPLRAGDIIRLGSVRGTSKRRPPAFEVPRTGSVTTLRVLPGPQDAGLSSALDTLATERFELALDSDRMGYRLGGAQLPAAPAGTMISGPTFTGAIQVPPSGEPLLLMADRQTTGGYPQIATVISADMRAAGQLAPGDAVRFVICSQREALSALVKQEGMLLALE